MYIYDSQTCGLRTRLDIYIRVDVVQVKYVIFSQTFHLTMWFFSLPLGSPLVIFCAVADCLSDGVDWYLDQIEDL